MIAYLRDIPKQGGPDVLFGMTMFHYAARVDLHLNIQGRYFLGSTVRVHLSTCKIAVRFMLQSRRRVGIISYSRSGLEIGRSVVIMKEKLSSPGFLKV